MNTQLDEEPMESIATLLQEAQYPTQALISIGATRYTDFWSTNFLEEDDDGYVVVYDATRYALGDIVHLLEDWISEGEGLSILHQKVV